MGYWDQMRQEAHGQAVSQMAAEGGDPNDPANAALLAQNTNDIYSGIAKGAISDTLFGTAGIDADKTRYKLAAQAGLVPAGLKGGISFAGFANGGCVPKKKGYADGGVPKQAIADRMRFEGKGGPREDKIPVKVAGQNINVSDGEEAMILPAKTANNPQAMKAIMDIIRQTNDGREPGAKLKEGGKYADGSRIRKDEETPTIGQLIMGGVPNPNAPAAVETPRATPSVQAPAPAPDEVIPGEKLRGKPAGFDPNVPAVTVDSERPRRVMDVSPGMTVSPSVGMGVSGIDWGSQPHAAPAQPQMAAPAQRQVRDRPLSSGEWAEPAAQAPAVSAVRDVAQFPVEPRKQQPQSVAAPAVQRPAQRPVQPARAAAPKARAQAPGAMLQQGIAEDIDPNIMLVQFGSGSGDGKFGTIHYRDGTTKTFDAKQTPEVRNFVASTAAADRAEPAQPVEIVAGHRRFVADPNNGFQTFSKEVFDAGRTKEFTAARTQAQIDALKNPEMARQQNLMDIAQLRESGDTARAGIQAGASKYGADKHLEAAKLRPEGQQGIIREMDIIDKDGYPTGAKKLVQVDPATGAVKEVQIGNAGNAGNVLSSPEAAKIRAAFKQGKMTREAANAALAKLERP